jgi:hypothetical protein
MKSPCPLKVPSLTVVSYRDSSIEPDLAAIAKHEAFLKARGRHYSNEAEAMKVRTRAFSWIRIHTFSCFAR